MAFLSCDPVSTWQLLRSSRERVLLTRLAEDQLHQSIAKTMEAVRRSQDLIFRTDQTIRKLVTLGNK